MGLMIDVTPTYSALYLLYFLCVLHKIFVSLLHPKALVLCSPLSLINT